MVLRILNLYACLGGNRYKWGNDHEITAVELDPVLCDLYSERFPNDIVICGDAHEYLLNHFQEFDFIWSSPPCQSHSRARFWASKGFSELCNFHDYDFLRCPIKEKIKIARNLVDYEAGKSILDAAIYVYEQRKNKQLSFNFDEKFN